MLQSTSVLSTIKAKYMATVEAAKEGLWLTGIVRELKLSQESLELHCDSQSVIHLLKNQVYHARTKHIDVRYHTIRDWIEDGKASLVKFILKIMQGVLLELDQSFALLKIGGTPRCGVGIL